VNLKSKITTATLLPCNRWLPWDALIANNLQQCHSSKVWKVQEQSIAESKWHEVLTRLRERENLICITVLLSTITCMGRPTGQQLQKKTCQATVPFVAASMWLSHHQVLRAESSENAYLSACGGAWLAVLPGLLDCTLQQVPAALLCHTSNNFPGCVVSDYCLVHGCENLLSRMLAWWGGGGG